MCRDEIWQAARLPRCLPNLNAIVTLYIQIMLDSRILEIWNKMSHHLVNRDQGPNCAQMAHERHINKFCKIKHSMAVVHMEFKPDILNIVLHT